MAIPLPPPFPKRSDNPPNFNDLAEGYFAWLDNDGVPGINAAAVDADGAADRAEGAAVQAGVARDGAVSARSQAGVYRDGALQSEQLAAASATAAEQAQSLTNYRSTLAQGIADFPVGASFLSDATGAMRAYRRISEEPGYEDMGDDAIPVTRSILSNADYGGAKIVYTRQPLLHAVPRTQESRNWDMPNLRDFGAIGDGVTDDTNSIQNALNSGAKNLMVPPGVFVTRPQDNSFGISIPDGLSIFGTGSGSELKFITDPVDDPNMTETWDAIRVQDVRTSLTTLKDFRISGLGGRRNNTGAITVRGGATQVMIDGIINDDAIGSAIVIEGLVASPYAVDVTVQNCDISGTGRHGIYFSGVLFARALNNKLADTGLESIVYRNCSDIDILDNLIAGDGLATAPHGIAAAAPPTGTYLMRRVRIIGNRGRNLPGALYYGQGVGVIHEDCDLRENVATDCMQVGSSHAYMLYRWSKSRINDNDAFGGRNRAYVLYGCEKNDFLGNNARNVNSEGNAVGVAQFVDYADPKDGSTTYSRFNNIDRNRFTDDRAVKKHVYGLQFTSGNNQNRIGPSNIIEGQTSAVVNSADGLSAQRLPVGEAYAFYHNNLATGSTTATTMQTIGEVASWRAVEEGYLKEFVLSANAAISGGTITCQLFKNGSAFYSIALTGNGAIRVSTTSFDIGLRTFSSGDLFTAQISATGIAGANPDILFQVNTSAA